MAKRSAVSGVSWMAALVGVALVVTGCKRQTPEEEVAARLAPLRPAAAARIEALQKLAPTIRASPKLTADSVTVPAGTIRFDHAETVQPITAGLIYETNLANLTAFHNLDPQPMPRAGLFNACGALLNGTGFTADHNKSTVLENCARARYAVVVRTIERVKPVVNKEQKTFTRGKHEGEVLVYDLDTGKSQGGFRFSETSEDRVETSVHTDNWEVDERLTSQVQTAILEGFEKFAGTPPG